MIYLEKKCLFIGSKQLGLSVLRAIYSTNPKSLVGCITINDIDDCRSSLDGFKEFCNSNNVNNKVINKPSELEKCIEIYKPDFCLVVGWYWILSENLLNLCKDGFVGIHASLLPSYRGFAPLVWAVINGERQTGVSLFYFDKNMDEGDIIQQKIIKIEESDYISNVLEKANNASVELIFENYPLLIEGKANRFMQDTVGVSYCSQRKAEDGKINWNNNKEYIYNFIRAQSHPYPGAFFIDGTGQKITIYEAEIFPYPYYGIPGQITNIEGDRITVCCKNGAVIIKPQISKEEIKNRLKFGQKLE